MQIQLPQWLVVIRFQICIFDILNTALNVWDIEKPQL